VVSSLFQGRPGRLWLGTDSIARDSPESDFFLADHPLVDARKSGDTENRQRNDEQTQRLCEHAPKNRKIRLIRVGWKVSVKELFMKTDAILNGILRIRNITRKLFPNNLL
jgi:hypothetical protein